MISNIEQKNVFVTINKKLHEKAKTFVIQLKEAGVTFSSMTTQDAQVNGFSPNNFHYFNSGTVAVECQGKVLYEYEAGDILTPYCTNEFSQADIDFTVKSNLKMEVASLDSIFDAMTSNKALLQIWSSMTQLNHLQYNQLIATLTPVKEQATPGFQRFSAGSMIIQEGTFPDYVYSVTKGSAVATHNNVEVGTIKEGEIFGAMAVFTEQKRTASVIAKTDCTVLMVHKNEFSEMIQTHPQLFLNILKDLSNTVKRLNSKITDIQ